MDQPTIVIISMLNASTSTIATRSTEGIFIGVEYETTKKGKASRIDANGVDGGSFLGR